MASRMLVIMDDPIVAMDLSQILQNCVPDAVIEVADTIDSAIEQSSASLAHLALAMMPSGHAAANLIAMMRRSVGERLILLSDDDELLDTSETGKVVILPRLFTDAMIASALFTLGVASR
ncbi:hypothetical protein N4R57_04010 [Rhodobacteraceae bacterium D3-12]|nr:hypothetical protein N4R57_04010 [Rhodobacteraceae bacterium D3-12]